MQELAKQIARIRDTEQLSLILAEQNIDFARQCTEKVYVIDTGRVVFQGSWPEFDADAGLITRYLAV